MIETLNGRNSSLGYIKVRRDFDLLEFDTRKNDFSHFMKALESFRSELDKLDSCERLTTDNEPLEKAKGTLIRTFGMGNYHPVDNGPFNSLLYDLSLDLITSKTTVGFVWRHNDSFKDFGTLTATARLLAQQTNVNSSDTSAPPEYIPFTSVEWVEQ